MTALKTILGKREYLALALVFMTNSLLEASWIIYIPAIMEKFSIGAGLMGSAIFFKAVGAFLGMPFIPPLINRIGEGKFTFITSILFCCSIPLIVLAPSYTILCVIFFVAGMLGGMMDIGMNALVSKKEKEDGVYIMSAAHGFWSVGGMIGALTASFLALSLDMAFYHIAILALGLIFLVLLFSHYYRHIHTVYESAKFEFSKINKSIIILSFICLIIMMGEGIIADWSTLFLKEVSLAPERLLGMGYAGFAFAMALGRFNMDWISKQYGSRMLIIAGMITSIIGTVLVLQGSSYVAILGFCIMGLGFSGIVPELFRLSGKLKSLTPAEGMTIVAGLGYAGFLVGPVLFGWIAETRSLVSSFMLYGCIVLISFFIFLFYKSKSANA